MEIGTRGRVVIASWDVTFYRSNLRGEMLQFALAPDVPSSTFNAGRTRHQGIEAGMDLALARWARLRQVYPLNDFRFRGDAQYGDTGLPVVPKHQNRAELRLGTDTLSMTTNIEWTPKGPRTDSSNTTRTPGYTAISISAEAVVR